MKVALGQHLYMGEMHDFFFESAKRNRFKALAYRIIAYKDNVPTRWVYVDYQVKSGIFSDLIRSDVVQNLLLLL